MHPGLKWYSSCIFDNFTTVVLVGLSEKWECLTKVEPMSNAKVYCDVMSDDELGIFKFLCSLFCK